MNNITQEMIQTLNTYLIGTSLIIKEKESTLTNAISYEICLRNKSFIDSYIINLSNEGIELIEKFFTNRGVSITWNNAHSIFW